MTGGPNCADVDVDVDGATARIIAPTVMWNFTITLLSAGSSNMRNILVAPILVLLSAISLTAEGDPNDLFHI